MRRPRMRMRRDLGGRQRLRRPSSRAAEHARISRREARIGEAAGRRCAHAVNAEGRAAVEIGKRDRLVGIPVGERARAASAGNRKCRIAIPQPLEEALANGARELRGTGDGVPDRVAVRAHAPGDHGRAVIP